jgi:hypothetical protein
LLRDRVQANPPAIRRHPDFTPFTFGNTFSQKSNCLGSGLATPMISWSSLCLGKIGSCRCIDLDCQRWRRVRRRFSAARST